MEVQKDLGNGVTARLKLSHNANDIRITGPNLSLDAIPEHLAKKCLLFHYPETALLARAIADASDARVELGEVKWA